MLVIDFTQTLILALRIRAAIAPKSPTRPWLMSENGTPSSADDLDGWVRECGMIHIRDMPNHLNTSGKEGVLASDIEKPDRLKKQLPDQ